MRCKVCKNKFEPKWFLQKTCFDPKCIIEWNKKVKADKWNKEKKAIKENLKTKGDYEKELQIVFNKFVRLRDKGNNCISCNKPCKKENAGHYRSVGSCPSLRFEELNVHLQCEYCNTHLHGNLIKYRINLISKIGIDKVELLESFNDLKKYSIEELKGLKEVYKLKIKNYDN